MIGLERMELGDSSCKAEYQVFKLSASDASRNWNINYAKGLRKLAAECKDPEKLKELNAEIKKHIDAASSCKG